MDKVLRCLTAWVAPILPFTADEAWLALTKDEGDSIHLHRYQDIDAAWKNEAVGTRWASLRALRSKVTSALEEARNAGDIGGSLSAEISLTVNQQTASLLDGVDLASLFITSEAEMTVGTSDEVGVAVRRSEGGKCARCWKMIASIPAEANDQICGRCEAVVAALPEVSA
jgi:isoleucyl-tRNA synthetase